MENGFQGKKKTKCNILKLLQNLQSFWTHTFKFFLFKNVKLSYCTYYKEKEKKKKGKKRKERKSVIIWWEC